LARSSSDTARNGEGALLVSAVPPDLCLGYVNTLSWRGRRAPAETLQTISDVLGWIERAAVFSPGSVDHAAAWAQDHEAQAARTFAEAIELREALFGIFSAIGAAEACDRRDFLISSAALARAPQRCHRVPMQRRFAWSIARTRNPVRDAMTPVLWSAADLMLGAAAIRSGVVPTRNVCGCFSTRARQTPAAGATWARAALGVAHHEFGVGTATDLIDERCLRELAAIS